MSLRLKDKQAIVAEISEIARQSASAVIVDYRGANLSQMNTLRAMARERKVYIRVVRNTLSSRALSGSNFEPLCQLLKGPVMLAFSLESPGAAEKLIRSFIKENQVLQVRGLAVSGQGLLGAEQIDMIADLPTREEALASLLFVMKAPVAKFACILKAFPAKLARVLLAVSEKRKES